MNIYLLNKSLIEARRMLHEKQRAWWAEQSRDEHGRFIASGGGKVEIGGVEVDVGDTTTPAARQGKEQLKDVLGDKAKSYEVGEDEDGNVKGKHKDVDETFEIGKKLTDTISNLVGYFDLVSSLAVKAVGYSAGKLAQAASDLKDGLQGIGAL